MEQFFAYLEEFGMLDRDVRERFEKIAVVKKVLKNQLLVREGQINDHLFFVNSGIMRGFINKGDKEMTIWFIGEGKLIASFESYELLQPTNENVQALEDGEVVVIHLKDLDDSYIMYPVLERFGRMVAQRISRFGFKISTGLRIDTAEERYMDLLAREPDIINRIPVKYIASYLKISNRHFSRIRAGLARK